MCARCGERNRVGDRFCSACGAGLPGQGRADAEVRKVVTILFCDAVGSTELGEVTDPETTRSVMTRYAETMSQIIRQHGGTVERFRGDEVMAVFGVPVVHEDDALRAVRAGREMQRSLARLNEELRERWGVELACRIGINTGEVVAGDPATGETFVTGDAVNLAKRLEQAAEPGGIMIGTATYPLVRDAVTVGPRERFTAKGKSEHVERMRLDEVDESAAGYARRLDAPLVGRIDELERVLAEIDVLHRERRCGIVSLVGPAGVGKSRLAREVVARFAPHVRVASGRCLAYGSGITYWPLVELVGDLGGIEAIEQAIRGSDDADAALKNLRTAIGESESAAASPELFWGVRRILELLALDRPLLICLEDLHWAEPTLLDLLEYIVAFATGSIAVLCNARPDLLETRPGWSQHHVVEVAQLTDAETIDLVQSLGIEDADTLRSITSTAEGNPLFAEQLAAMVLESRPEPGEKLELPASIQALLSARLESLQSDERHVLERASVVGKEFWQRAVVELSLRDDRQRVAGCLLSLTRKGFVRPVRSDVAGEDTFAFRHILIREVAYTSMPKVVRAELHERFATWLPSRAADVGDYDEIVGYHAEQAHQYFSQLAPRDDRTVALAKLGATRLGAAGRRALAREDVPAAVLMFERALALLPENDPHRSELLSELGSAAIRAGEWTRAKTLLEDAVAEAKRQGDRRSELRATVDLQWQRSYTVPTGAAEEDRRVAEAVIPELETIQDHLGLSKAWWLLSEADTIACRWGARAKALERAIVHARQLPDDGQLRVLVVLYAQALHHGPTPVPEAVQRCEALLAEHLAAPTFEAGLSTTLAGLRAMQGRFDEARELYAASIAVYEEFGLRFRRAVRSIVGAQIESLAGDLDAAEAELRAGYSMLDEMGERGTRSTVAGFLADVLSSASHDAEAERFVEITQETAGETDVVSQVLWRRARARTCARRGETRAAEQLARHASRLAEATDFLDLRAGTLAVLGEVLDAAGKSAPAAASVEAALEHYERKGNIAALRRARPVRQAVPDLPFRRSPS